MANFPSLFRPSSLLARSNDPFREMTRLQRQIDRMFDDFFTAWPEQTLTKTLASPSFTPSYEVQDTDTHYVLSFDLPGVKKEDIKIELVGDQLHISGERKEEHEEKSKSRYQMERFYGSFDQTLSLPAGIKPEQIETEYRDGVLKVALPKVEAAKTQQIKIGEGKPGFFQKLLGQKKEETKEAPAGKVA
jgi:HSP20 family protein